VIESIVQQLGDIPAQAQAEAHTLEALQLENKRMKRELDARPVQYQAVEPTVEIRYVDKPVLNGEVQMFRESAALSAALAPVAQLSETLAPLQQLPQLLAPLASTLQTILAKVETVERAQANPPVPPQEFVRVAPAHSDYNLKPRRTAPAAGTAEGLTGYDVDLLKTFARRHPLPLTKSQLALLAGKGKKSSALDSALAKIKRMGLVTNDSEMELTAAGFAALGSDVPEAPKSFEEITYLWREVLSEYERALYDPLVRTYHAGNLGLTTDQLSELSGKSKTSSQFQSTVAMFVKNKIAERQGERLRLHNPLASK
jgi:hypothetical protein